MTALFYLNLRSGMVAGAKKRILGERIRNGASTDGTSSGSGKDGRLGNEFSEAS